ncbi:MAG TPA: hypothetical protein VFE51_10655 [Verrucomicrobiae bacterium]|nr:hypothetical protein [Verrucomicrobiae bacterium]
MKIINKIGIGLATVALLAVASSSLRGNDEKHDSWKKIVIDVACDATTFSLNKTMDSDAGPVRGSSFIVNGKIYPGGTIQPGNGFNINTPGMIGTWVCRGAFNFNDASVPAQSSTQSYLFDPSGSLAVNDSLASVGEEGGVTTHRVVSGGTGVYRGVIGEVQQEVLGVNSSGLFNFRFTFKVRSLDD